MKLFWIVTLLLGCSVSVKADPACTDIATEGKLSISLDKADAALSQKAQTAVDRYFEWAKTAKKNTVKQVLSPFDRSASEAIKWLHADANHYAGYQTIESVTVSEAFEWGDYVIALLAINVQGQTVHMAQAVQCNTNLCLASNMLDRPETEERLILKFANNWFRSGGSKSAAAGCNADQLVYSYSKNQISTRNKPVRVFSNLKVESTDVELSTLVSKTCAEGLENVTEEQLYDMQGSGLISLIKACFINTTPSKLIPYIGQDGSAVSRNYYNLPSFLSVLKFGQLEQVVYAQDDYELNIVKATANGVTSLLVLPRVEAEGGQKIDWKLYSSPEVAVYADTPFAQWVMSELPNG